MKTPLCNFAQNISLLHYIHVTLQLHASENITIKTTVFFKKINYLNLFRNLDISLILLSAYS